MSKINKIIFNTLVKYKLIHQSDIIDYAFNSFPGGLYEKSLNLIGVNNTGASSQTGELFLLENILKDRLGNNPIIVEVGANDGTDTRQLRSIFPNSSIYSFEPNRKAYAELVMRTKHPNQHNYNIGLGAKKCTMTHYSYTKLAHTQLATGNINVLKELFIVKDKLKSYKINIQTLDQFAKHESIEHIDFLKIDIEGYELDVIKGAINLIKNKKIDYIQFEFNVHNVYNRYYLRDFYNCLSGYNLYRILTNGLYYLGDYHPRNEIFQYQNYLATSKRVLSPRIVSL